MNYTADFAQLQNTYTEKYPNALRMRDYLPDLKNKSVLDVGCGSGIDLTYFASLGAKYVAGNDISPEMIEIAKTSLTTVEIRNEPFSYLSWKDDSFDVVWSKYALNCASDITTPLKEINRVLKKNGIALIQVTHPLRTLQFLKSQDYFDEKSSVEYPLINNKHLIEPHHIISSWINAIHEAGFIITHCEEILNRPKEEYHGVITPSAIIFILKKGSHIDV